MHDQLILIESQDKSQSYECARLLYELSGQLKRMSTATTATSLNSPPTGATSAHTDDDDNYEDGQPFEFQMMEVLLARTIHALRAESESLLPAIEHFLSAQVSVHDVRKETLTSLLHVCPMWMGGQGFADCLYYYHYVMRLRAP